MIVLDTHVWIWWVSNPERLSDNAEKFVDAAMLKKAVYLSSISSWEVALLVANDRLALTMDVRDWIAKTEALPFVNFVPVDNAIAIKSIYLPEPLHRDPADRIIIATALTLGAALLTTDEKIMNYPHVQTVW